MPGEPMPAPDACDAIGDPPGGLGSRRPAELRQEVECELPLHTGPHVPPREPRPEAGLPRPRHPRLHVLDHVLRRRAPEPRQQRRRQQVGVLDRAGRLGVLQTSPRHVRQRQHERLLALVVRVVEHCDRDRLRRLARLERQRAARRRVVLARPRAAVPRRVADRHRVRRRTAQRHREGHRRASRLLRPGIAHRQRCQTLRRRPRRLRAREIHIALLRVDPAREPAQRSRYRPGQLVARETQLIQIREAAQGRRYRPRQLVAAQT